MQVPQTDYVKTILNHHIKKRFPVFKITHGFKMLIQRRTGAVGVPWQIKFNTSELKIRFTIFLLYIFQRNTISQMLCHSQGSIDQSSFITTVNCDYLIFGYDRKRFSSKPGGIYRKADEEIVISINISDTIISFNKRIR